MYEQVVTALDSAKGTGSSSAALWTPAAVISGCALIFTVGSFWWLYVRRGNLKSFEPHSFSAAILPQPPIYRIRLPLVFYNTGAVPIVVQNLRLEFVDEPSAAPLPWVATRSHIKPEKDDGHAFPAVFSVAGRTAAQTFQEFGAASLGFKVAAIKYRVRLQAKLGHKEDWDGILDFTFHARRISDPGHFITYENTPGIIPQDELEANQIGLDLAQTGPRGQAGG